MWVHRGATDIEVRAPAKLNLFFEVHGRRSDGYHEIETLMMPISLYDRLVFTDRPPRRGQAATITFCCRSARGTCRQAGSEDGGLPEDEALEGRKNIVLRAVELIRRRSG